MWRKLIGPFKEFGPLVGLLYMASRLIGGVSDQCGLYLYELMVQPITSKPLLPANLAKNLIFVEIERGDPAIARMPAREDIKALRLSRAPSAWACIARAS